MSHAEGAVMVWGSEPPGFSIGYMDPLGEWDSGFTVLFDDAPEPEDVAEYVGEHPLIGWTHLACLLELYPEIGRGLDVAREHRLADLDERGEWIVGDLRRLEE